MITDELGYPIPRIDFKVGLKTYKNQSIRIARDLLYGESVVDRIKKAKSIIEVDRVLTTARKAMRD